MAKPDKMERIAARMQNKVAEVTAQLQLRIVMLEDELDEYKEKYGPLQEAEDTPLTTSAG